ncbi:MAG TPA: SIR2 family protein [Candidatus Acidoferrales bacterium]
MAYSQHAQGDPQTAKHFCETLFRIVSNERLVLFAGAGVGVRARLPDWRGYVQYLISVARKYEKETAAIMDARANSGLLAEAISYYKLCPLIPEGEKFAQLAAPLDDARSDPAKLDMLVKLPFESIVTTNYDRTLDHAWAAVNRKAPRTFELDDGSLKQAAFSSEFYIARIHGRAIKPETMVVSTEDFRELDENTSYKDFLVQNILTRRNCLFMGYSFLDPAIKKILQLLEKQMSPTYPRKHYAFLPSDASDLASKLAHFNIEVILYPAHAALWACVDSLPLKLVGVPKPAPEAIKYPLPYDQMRVFLASCYVQSKMSQVAVPVRDLVLRGIVLSLVDQESDSKTVPQVSRLLRQIIPLDPAEAELVTDRAIDALAEKGSVSIVEGKIKTERQSAKVLEENLDILVRGALSRLLVREGVEAKQVHVEAVKTALQEVFLTRGWDLGAQFSGAHTTGTFDLYELIKKCFRRILPTEPFEKHDRIAKAVYDLLKRPDEGEAQILADLARLSFGLNVLLKVGNSALKLEAIPERIYFDASILMPAITDGHPFRPVYQSTIEKISKAAAEANKTCELLVIREFLNEIVHHRNLSIAMVKELGLEDPERLEKHVLYYGAENTNVFVGSYASWVGRQKKLISFSNFLDQAAPYTSELSLATFIERLGIRTIKTSTSDPQFKRTILRFMSSLGNAYKEFQEVGWGYGKPDVLIEHEALQLAQIEMELKVGRRSYFVTADKGLREIVNTIRLGNVWNVVISHLGLVQLTDLLLGVDAEPRSLARALWGIMEVDDHAALRDYFIDLALKKRDEALVMTLPQILNEFVEQAEKAAKLEGVRFFTKQLEDKAKAARFLDRFEKQFFENMAEAVRRRKAQEKN